MEDDKATEGYISPTRLVTSHKAHKIETLLLMLLEHRYSRRESVAVPPSTYLGSEQLFIDMQYSPRTTNFSFPQFASNPSDSGKRAPLPEKIPSVMA